MLLDHTQRRSTVGRTPLDEWSAVERPQAAQLLKSWVRIPPGAWIFVCCECRVLSGRGLCDELITRPEESYRPCCGVMCDLETSRIGAPYIYDISNLRVNDLSHFWKTQRTRKQSLCCWGSLIGTVTNLWAGWCGVRIPAGVREFSLFLETFWSAVGPTRPSLQWVSTFLSRV